MCAWAQQPGLREAPAWGGHLSGKWQARKQAGQVMAWPWEVRVWSPPATRGVGLTPRSSGSCVDSALPSGMVSLEWEVEPVDLPRAQFCLQRRQTACPYTPTP